MASPPARRRLAALSPPALASPSSPRLFHCCVGAERPSGNAPRGRREPRGGARERGGAHSGRTPLGLVRACLARRGARRVSVSHRIGLRGLWGVSVREAGRRDTESDRNRERLTDGNRDRERQGGVELLAGQGLGGPWVGVPRWDGSALRPGASLEPGPRAGGFGRGGSGVCGCRSR